MENIAGHGTNGPRKYFMLAERKKGRKKKGERKKEKKGQKEKGKKEKKKGKIMTPILLNAEKIPPPFNDVLHPATKWKFS